MPLSGRLTDLNCITQTPSGTLDNTALTLIQVLNLYRGLAVINFNYSLFSLARSYENELQPKFDPKQSVLPSTHGITSRFLSLHVSFCNLWICLVCSEC